MTASMVIPRFLRAAASAAVLVMLCQLACGAQSSAPSTDPHAPEQPGPVYTLGAQSRLVFEDVLVTDSRGRPVHGLPASAFHVFDQGRPQLIRSVEEGVPAKDEALADLKPMPPGTFTNAENHGSHAAYEVLLIDADDLVIQDQMFLLAQLRRAIAVAPTALPIAVFRVSNGKVVQIRGFSSDRADLQRAVGEGFPVLTHAIDSQFQSAVEQLMTVSAFLQQVPGRKNVLWFSGAFPLVSASDDEGTPGGITVDYAAREQTIHQIQEALAEARVSVYPIDVRGVLTADLAPPTAAQGDASSPTAGRNPSATLSRTPIVAGPFGAGDAERRDSASRLAAATGGKAYSLNNLADEVGEAFDLGTRAYTVEYVPNPYSTDESWHRVRITVDGNYHLSYRPGYLATWSGVPGGRQGFRLEDGEKVSTGTTDALKPLVFTAKVAPAPDAGGKGPLRLRISFQIAADQVSFVPKNGRWQDQLLVCSYAYDVQGRMRGGKLQQLDTSLTRDQWQRAKGEALAAEQTIDVPKNAGYLVLAVRDKTSRRIGTYLLPMRAVRALPTAE